jgi:hypothetical protein
VIDDGLRQRLIGLARQDAETRERLAADGTLFQGYHPEMEAVHGANAAALDEIIVESGWPSRRLAGEDGAEAAWLIAQHAIGLPDFQRRCLARLEAAVAKDDAPAWQLAYLADRIRTLEGKAQLYGTQFDWDEAGEMSPLPIEDPDGLDARRQAIGLPPLAVATRRHRESTASVPRPPDRETRRAEMQAWARHVGWR